MTTSSVGGLASGCTTASPRVSSDGGVNPLLLPLLNSDENQKMAVVSPGGMIALVPANLLVVDVDKLSTGQAVGMGFGSTTSHKTAKLPVVLLNRYVFTADAQPFIIVSIVS